MQFLLYYSGLNARIFYLWTSYRNDGITHLPVGVGQVEFVADHHDRDVGRVLGLDDLVPDGGSLLERLGVGDGVDEHKRVGRRYGQRAHGRELVRAGRVQDVQVDLDALHREPAVVHFLHGALVLGRELPVQELRDQRRLAHPRGAHHHDLVPGHVRRVWRRLQVVVMVAATAAAAAFYATTVKKKKKVQSFIWLWMDRLTTLLGCANEWICNHIKGTSQLR